ncbi:MAG: substrate-binding domain-containing protein [Actinomycetota bacterium]|nr:substrate-binding domain-containing protein [Actinomycetota bacterium]
MDHAAAGASAQYAKDNGVFVISHVSSFDNADVYVGLDELAFGLSTGEAAGKYVKENLDGKAKAAILNADTLGGDLVLRSQGLSEGLLEHAPEAEIVANVTAFEE